MELFHWIYFVLLVVVAFTGTVKYANMTTSSRVMLLLVVITIISEILATYLKITLHSNVIVYHIFGPIEASLIVWAFYEEFRLKIMIFIIGAIVCFGVINSFFLQSYKSLFNSYFFLADAVLATLLSLIYFYKLLHQKIFFKFTDYPMFWISIGFVLFYVTNLVMMGTFNVLKHEEHKVLFSFFLQLRFITNLLLYFLFLVAFLSKQCKLQIN